MEKTFTVFGFTITVQRKSPGGETRASEDDLENKVAELESQVKCFCGLLHYCFPDLVPNCDDLDLATVANSVPKLKLV